MRRVLTPRAFRAGAIVEAPDHEGNMRRGQVQRRTRGRCVNLHAPGSTPPIVEFYGDPYVRDRYGCYRVRLESGKANVPGTHVIAHESELRVWRGGSKEVANG